MVSLGLRPTPLAGLHGTVGSDARTRLDNRRRHPGKKGQRAVERLAAGITAPPLGLGSPSGGLPLRTHARRRRPGRPGRLQHGHTDLTWREGDEFLAGELLQRFRIVGISPASSTRDEAGEFFDAFWLVEAFGLTTS
jgi:hypothetical protein